MYDGKGALNEWGYLSIIFELGFVVFAGYVIVITSSDTYAMDSQVLQSQSSTEESWNLPCVPALSHQESSPVGDDRELSGVGGVWLGMTVSQVERRLGKVCLMGPIINLNYVGVNPHTGGAIEKDGFNYSQLSFTRKDHGQKLEFMLVTQHYDSKPDWKAIEEKLVKRYGKPSKIYTKEKSAGLYAETLKRYQWGPCARLNPRKCNDTGLIVNFNEKGDEGETMFELNKYNAWVSMEFLDGKLSHENYVAAERAKQAKKHAKETKTASQVDNLNF